MDKYQFQVGDKFNEWEVVDSISIRRTKSNALHFLCKCSCGLTEKYVQAADLAKGSSKRCNKCSIFSGYKDLSGSYIAAVKKGARERNLKFDARLTPKFLYDRLVLQDFKCSISGLPITLERDYYLKRENQTASLDRIFNFLGYEIGNIQWVHKTVNIMKNSLTDEQLVSMCEIIANYNN